MKCLPSAPYPENEKPKLALLEKLFVDWHQHFVNNGSTLKKHKADDMVFDGFCPGYFSQKKRILIIGKEPRWISGQNYIDILYPRYRENKKVGSTYVNNDRFHNRMIKIVYGILNEMPEWKDIDDADKLGDTLSTANGLSFACMNISKLSNDSDQWQTDRDVFNEAHRLSTNGRNFIEEEIAILEPQIIIAMTLKEKLASLGTLSVWIPESAGVKSCVKSCWLESCGHRSLLIDSYHFSWPFGQDIAHYYNPICDAIRHSEAVAVAE
jgi:hypothetical protein